MNNFDPGTKAEEVKEAATTEQVAAPTAGEALESAAQDKAMGATQDSEEGSTEG